MNNKKSLAYKMGTALAFVISVCVMIIVLAVTYRFVTWIL